MPRDELTRREIQILQRLAKGESNKTLARNLYISEKTVKNHLYRIYEKIDVHSRTQAAIYALENRIAVL